MLEVQEPRGCDTETPRVLLPPQRRALQLAIRNEQPGPSLRQDDTRVR